VIDFRLIHIARHANSSPAMYRLPPTQTTVVSAHHLGRRTQEAEASSSDGTTPQTAALESRGGAPWRSRICRSRKRGIDSQVRWSDQALGYTNV